MPASLVLPILWLGIAPPAVPGQLGSAVECSVHRHVAVCPVSIGSAGTFTFIVDTGTRRTVLDAGLAARLGLQLQRDSLDSPAGALDARRAEVGPLRFGPTLAARLTVSVCPLASLLPVLGVKPDGILGLDVLARAPLTIDFSTGRVWTVAARLSHETTLIGTDGGFAAARLEAATAQPGRQSRPRSRPARLDR